MFYSGTHFCLWLKGSAYLPLFNFKERNSGLFRPIFLKFTFDNFTSPVGLVILKFYLPRPNFTSLGHRACTIFRRLMHSACCCSLLVWRNFLKGNLPPPVTYFCLTLDPPLGRYGHNILMHVQGLDHFTPTKFRKHPLSGSVVKANYVFPYIYMH